jgi:hypothetical protein
MMTAKPALDITRPRAIGVDGVGTRGRVMFSAARTVMVRLIISTEEEP